MLAQTSTMTMNVPTAQQLQAAARKQQASHGPGRRGMEYAVSATENQLKATFVT